MRISLVDSTKSGFKHWSATHTENWEPGLDRSAETEERRPGSREKATLDGRHQPWLVPGVGNVL